MSIGKSYKEMLQNYQQLHLENIQRKILPINAKEMKETWSNDSEDVKLINTFLKLRNYEDKKPNNSPVPERLQSRALKKVASKMVDVFTIIFQISLVHGTVLAVGTF